MINFKVAEFVKSAVEDKDHLRDLPQILFIGKSNVGKSSLINALTEKKSLAYVSKTPGLTKLVNYYLIDKKFYLVDVPGFGYRKISYEKDNFDVMMDSYFKNNHNLKCIFYLLDSRREFNKEENQTIDFIKKLNIPFVLILTKSDKLLQSEKARLLKYLNQTDYHYLFNSIKNNKSINDTRNLISTFIE